MNIYHYLEKLVVKLHYGRQLDLYELCAKHDPERWALSNRKANIPTQLRWSVWRRDDFCCHYCCVYGESLTLDHVDPEAEGGDTDMGNLVTACATCNKKKGTQSYEDFVQSKWLTKKRDHLLRSSTTPEMMKKRLKRGIPTTWKPTGDVPLSRRESFQLIPSVLRSKVSRKG